MLPLYITIVDGHFARCVKTGVINWTNTTHYTIEELQVILQTGRPVVLVKHTGDAHGHYKKPDWMDKVLKGL